MTLIEFTRDTLEDYRVRLDRAVDGLTDEEFNWRPNRESNSIAFIMWHTTALKTDGSQFSLKTNLTCGRVTRGTTNSACAKTSVASGTASTSSPRSRGSTAKTSATTPRRSGPRPSRTWKASTQAIWTWRRAGRHSAIRGRRAHAAPGHMAFLRGLQRGLDG